MSAVASGSITDGPRTFWIGLNSLELEGVWVWGNGENPVTYTHWAGNQPNNVDNGVDQDCTEMDLNYNNQWYDDDCNRAHGLICEVASE